MKILLYGDGNDIIDKQIQKIIEQHREIHLKELQRLEIEFRYLTMKEAYESLLMANIDDLELFTLYDKRQREYYNNYFNNS